MAFIAPLAAAALPALTSSAGMAALTGASAVLGAVSSVQQGNYQAAVARNNAKIAEENAARISEAAQKEGMRSDLDYRALLGEQLAAQGASGLDILGRSQVAARALTLKTGRTAARDIAEEGLAGSRRSLQEAADFRSQGKQAKTQGYIGAAGSLLQGASSIGSSMLKGRRTRSFERGGRG